MLERSTARNATLDITQRFSFLSTKIFKTLATFHHGVGCSSTTPLPLLMNVFEVWYILFMSHHEDETSRERVFTLFEANQLIPKLQSHLSQIQSGKSVVLKTREEIKKAAAQACAGGGTHIGALYVRSLQTISTNLQAIHALGVIIKDVDLGLCDFPYLCDGRVVYLCWKLGEQEIGWWHEVTSGYKNRCPLDHLT